MKKEFLKINHIPAIIWGENSSQVIIAVHGNMSHKEDIPIELLAKHALSKGYQVISFDLPKHGDRKDEETLCKVQNCVQEFQDIINYVNEHWAQKILFANSLGAYFSLMAFKDESFEKCLFLSPLVNMQRMIENMMNWFNVSIDMLKSKQSIETPIGQTLYYDYYCYVKEHPVTNWKFNTAILYGSLDDTCEYDTIHEFAQKFHADLTIVNDAEHYFHTPDQLKIYEEWLEANI